MAGTEQQMEAVKAGEQKEPVHTTVPSAAARQLPLSYEGCFTEKQFESDPFRSEAQSVKDMAVVELNRWKLQVPGIEEAGEPLQSFLERVRKDSSCRALQAENDHNQCHLFLGRLYTTLDVSKPLRVICLDRTPCSGDSLESEILCWYDKSEQAITIDCGD